MTTLADRVLNVVDRGPVPQMLDVATRRIVTEMHRHQRRRPEMMFEDDPMRVQGAAVVADVAVAGWIAGTGEHEAVANGRASRHDPLVRCRRHRVARVRLHAEWITCVQIPPIVQLAPAGAAARSKLSVTSLKCALHPDQFTTPQEW